MSSREYQKDSKPEEKEDIETPPVVEAKVTKKKKIVVIDKPEEITHSQAELLVAKKPKRPLSEKQKANAIKLVESNKAKYEARKIEKQKEQEKADYERLKKLESEGKIQVKVTPKPPPVPRPNHALKKRVVVVKEEEEEDEVAPLPSPKRERSVSPAVKQATEKVGALIEKLSSRIENTNPYSALLSRRR